MPEISDWCVYMLQCCDGTFYTGCTNNLDNRIKIHSDGRGAKYTRARLPVALVYCERVENRSTALQREYAIKQLNRQEKLALIHNV